VGSGLSVTQSNIDKLFHEGFLYALHSVERR
jgi:hypothetical protein